MLREHQILLTPPIIFLFLTASIHQSPNTTSPVGKGVWAYILQQIIFVATNRNGKFSLVFNNIVSVLEDTLSEIGFPQYLYKIFRKFISNLTAVANKHFERHVRRFPRICRAEVTAKGKSLSKIQTIRKKESWTPTLIRAAFANTVQNPLR